MLPLNGVRVLAVEQYGAGPFGTLYLADLGAEVIKIENPSDGGDMSRAVGPHFFAPDDSQFFHTFNRNKLSLTLDLAIPEARVVLHDLVRSADALACNLRGDVPEKLGLTYAHLKAHNPRIVCAFLSAYGRDGPRAAWPGFDYLMQAETGYFALTGEPGGPPTRCGLSIVDLMSGLAMAYALVSALLAARASGEGRDIDVSLFDVALFNVSYLATWYLNAGFRQDRLPRSAHPSLTPCQLYRTADGWIYIMCNKEKFWPALCLALGRPEWATDSRFRTFADRLANRALVNEVVESELIKRATGEWLAIFAGTVPAAPVLDVAQALENPFVTEYGRLADVPHAAAPGGAYRTVAPPVRGADNSASARPAPALGADTEDILRRLGYDDARIQRLKAAGAI
ncbi:MAG: CoA transferase [Betaproteobacteria bacterium]|nr:CoA transferase [Betaproteobacteria bacterium]